MFKLRLFSGILLLVATVATLYFGGVVTFAVLTMISLIGVNELLRIFQMEKSAMAVISLHQKNLWKWIYRIRDWATGINTSRMPASILRIPNM